MTPTTDLQKPFTDEDLHRWANSAPFLPPGASLIRDLSAHVLQLETENKRLREGLDDLIGTAEKTLNAIDDYNEDRGAHLTGAPLFNLARSARKARAALKGGEI